MIKPEEKKEVQDKISALKDAQKGDNIEEIKLKTKDLSETIQKIGAELYKQQTPPAGEQKPKDGEEPTAEEVKVKEE